MLQRRRRWRRAGGGSSGGSVCGCGGGGGNGTAAAAAAAAMSSAAAAAAATAETAAAATVAAAVAAAAAGGLEAGGGGGNRFGGRAAPWRRRRRRRLTGVHVRSRQPYLQHKAQFFTRENPKCAAASRSPPGWSPGAPPLRQRQEPHTRRLLPRRSGGAHSLCPMYLFMALALPLGDSPPPGEHCGGGGGVLVYVGDAVMPYMPLFTYLTRHPAG